MCGERRGDTFQNARNSFPDLRRKRKNPRSGGRGRKEKKCLFVQEGPPGGKGKLCQRKNA